MSEAETMSEMSDVRHMEGFDMLNKSKQEELEAKFREQKKVRLYTPYEFEAFPDLLNRIYARTFSS